MKTTVSAVLGGFRETGEGQEVVINGRKVFRVRVMGRVVDLFINNKGTYGDVVLDDETGTMRVKFFSSSIAKMEDVKLGDLVDVVGRVRKFKGEVHMIADEVAVLADMNWELLRKLELCVPDDRREKKVLAAIKMGVSRLEELEEEFGSDVVDPVTALLEKGEVYEASPRVYKAVE
jgi:RPA family protein